MILDTSAVSAILAGNPGIEPKLEVSERHHLPLVVVGEYLFGLMGSKRKRTLEPLLRRLVEESYVLYPDLDTAAQYAVVRHELKAQGTPIPENDVWIAALARQYDLEVLSRDRHLDRVKGITRLTW